MLLLQGPVKGNVITWTEVQPRFLLDDGRLGQFLLRQGVGVRLKNDIELILGYHWQVNQRDPDNIVRENRFWQQFAAHIYTAPNGVDLAAQVRLEQRKFSSEPDTIWRTRAQFRLYLPLNGPGTIGPVIGSETMFNLNSGNNRSRRGFEQQRTSVGLYVPLGNGFAMQGDYINQRIVRIGPDRIVHVASLKLAYKLGYKGKKNQPAKLPDLPETPMASP